MSGKGSGRFRNRREKLAERIKNKKKPGRKRIKKKSGPKPKKRKTPKQQRIEMQKLKRRNRVSKLMIERPMTQREMADVLGVSATTINGDIKWLKQQYIEEAIDNVEHAKAQVIRRLEYVVREAHDAWEKSKAEQVEVKTKQKKVPASGSKQGQQGQGQQTTEEENSEKRKNTPGDPRFLEQFRDAAVEIASYEGVNKLQGTQNLDVNINLPDLPAEYSDFGLTPNIPEDEQKRLPIPGQEVAEVDDTDSEEDIEEAEIIDDEEYEEYDDEEE